MPPETTFETDDPEMSRTLGDLVEAQFGEVAEA